jgi:hypothetical protein
MFSPFSALMPGGPGVFSMRAILGVVSVLILMSSVAEAGYPLLQDGGARNAFVSSYSRSCQKNQTPETLGVSQGHVAAFCDCAARAMADVVNDQEFEYVAINGSFPDTIRQKALSVGALCRSKVE